MFWALISCVFLWGLAGESLQTKPAEAHLPQIRKFDGTGVLIAVIDSGLKNGLHLRHRPARGWNTVDETSQVEDDLGHGTMVSSVIADPEIGIAPGVTILPVKVMDRGHRNVKDLAEGIVWAVDAGADIINVSMGFDQYDEELVNAVDYAAQKGVLVVASAGNEGVSGLMYPARIEDAISVAAVNDHGMISPFSNYAPEVDIAAKGEDVPVKTYDRKLKRFVIKKENGTSFACAMVSAHLALLKQAFPHDSPETLRQKMINRSQVPPFWDFKWGQGWLKIPEDING